MATLWRCPSCGRRFAKSRQLHSCVAYSVNDHFAGRPPVVREMFEKVVAAAEQSGPVRLDAVKSGIKLATHYHFAVASPRKDGLKLELLMDGAPADPRVLTSLQLGPAKYAWYLTLTSPADIDRQLKRWLARAYQLSQA